MRKFEITGMSCAACSARVEKAVSALEGISDCSVNLLTNSMTVEGEASDDAIISAVQKAGYGAFPDERKKHSFDETHEKTETSETKKIVFKLIASAILLMLLMYLSMGHNMLGLPVGAFLDNDHVSMGVIQLLLSASIMVVNQKFFINGFKGLIRLSPNMDTLVSLGSATSFIYSVFVLFAEIKAQTAGDIEKTIGLHHDLYFESAAMILVLITVGKLLEAYSKGRTTDALKGLMALAPPEARVVRDGEEVLIPAEELKVGDIFVLRPGDRVPADGIVIEGSSSVDESALTGESMLAEKKEGDEVSTATINVYGHLFVRVTKVGEDTTLAQIVRAVGEAASSKAPIAKLADKVAGFFVPVVMGIALITTVVWLISGHDIGFALSMGISVLVISCPCSLGLATPVAIMVGSGVGARNGILFKTAASLEQAGRIETVVLDKTGTITEGTLRVTDVFPAPGVSESDLLGTAASLEALSEHPLSRAVISFAKEKEVETVAVTDFKAVPGKGLKGVSSDGEDIVGGNLEYVSESVSIPEDMITESKRNAEKGKTPLFFAKGGAPLGLICVSDTIRSESEDAVSELRSIGVNSIMLTGDNPKTADYIASQVGIDEVIAGVLPTGKADEIKRICAEHKTAMVGDGINDAPALKSADLGIAIGAGTDIAIDSADVVLINSSLYDLLGAIKLGKATLKNIKENLFWAFFYNLIGIPIAAGVLYVPFGIKLSPMIGAAAMSLSSVCVVLNALRLNRLRLKHKADVASREAETIDDSRKEDQMKNVVELKIEGMMCTHCEARVKAALEGVSGVESAEVSHEKNSASVVCGETVNKEALVKAVEDAGYTVV